MNTIQLGLCMILIPVAAATSFSVGVMFVLMFKETAKAYIDKNVAMMIIMVLIWSFVIGTAMVLIGSL